MSNVAMLTAPQMAFKALVEDGAARTGCAPIQLVQMLLEGELSPDDEDLTDEAAWKEIARDLMICADLEGLPCNHGPVTRSILDEADIALARGLAVAAEASEYELAAARIAVRVGENAAAAKRALDNCGLRFGWQATEGGRAAAEALATLRFAPLSFTVH